ncbi:uracil-DNA glycosylase [Paludibacterium yongneupense]|uniref:uracil-DNA glycosylase n=1 Tax=Paludibacterium yongneupense TaxID=400061 RepID=UPI000402E8DB|nr:uracil-DNA glycosylase [Paludibacterium yongneupense]
MNRRNLVLEAMGLGPRWQRRGWADAEPAAASDAAAAPVQQAAPENRPAPQPAEAAAKPAPPVPTAVAAGSDDLPWDALERAVSGCQRCRLAGTRKQTVFGRGNPGARLMLIGEAPGEQEDAQGEPFVGRAGQLLDNMLAAIGLDRDRDVYIANVIKCRPPGNRNPGSDEIAACQGYLLQQIRHVKPEMIVALGRFAAQTLLATDQSISRLRGRLHHYQGIPTVVTFHPAYLLRNLPDKALAWQDMVFARRTLAAATR